MAKLYVDANPSYMAYVLEGSGMSSSGYDRVPFQKVGKGRNATFRKATSMEAEYLAVMYGLNQYYLAWNKELDARQDNLDTERLRATGEEEFYNVATPSDRTKRPLPPPVEILSDNEVVVRQLSRQYHIANDRLRELAKMIFQQTEKVEVKFSWVSRKENLAGKMLP